ncbi:uncharacterized protein C10orf67 homolog, mitochondrial [Triplophysa dalaica]|uniref:uncharacterized protein C10orf67 homolog, mitochondrial n=1 Tax=Triplophysa dalaica TaxID=1582913 RepID=UPI0024DF3686|nr:uncharacterized protein C10orf67 homolog, mitochondrial [Triplophysa dalaica]
MDEIKKRLNSITDEAEDDLILKEIEEINRFNVSNQLRSGFFGQDASVQTEESDLPNVKLLAANTAELLKEVQVLREDTEKKLKIIHVQYETKLQQEADVLYTRMNEKVTSLEDCHKEKLSVLRRSYQQQLSDALQVVKSSYKKSNRNLEETALFSDSTDGRVKELLEELEEKNLKIQCMTEQKNEIDPEGAADTEKNRLKSENEKLKDKIDSLHVEVEEIRQSLESKEQTLAVELAMVKLEAENSKKALQKLTSEHEQVKIQLRSERENGQKKMKQFKEEMEKDLAQVEASHMKEKAAIERKFKEAKSAEPASMELVGNTELVQTLKELRKTEEGQKREIERLNKQLCTSNQVWEKKFEILRQSFHAIKDEMFLRQSLQRQEAILHNPSVSFAMDVPCAPLQKSDSNLKRLGSTSVAPLPRIGAGGQQKKNRTIGTMDLCLQTERPAFTTSDSLLVVADEKNEE